MLIDRIYMCISTFTIAIHNIHYNLESTFIQMEFAFHHIEKYENKRCYVCDYIRFGARVSMQKRSPYLIVN